MGEITTSYGESCTEYQEKITASAGFYGLGGF